MNREKKSPIFLRRIVGPLLLLGLTAGAVNLFQSVQHEMLRDAEHDYGSFAIGLAMLVVLVRLINYVVFDVVFHLRTRTEAPALLREIAALLIFGLGLGSLLRLFLAVHLTTVLATSALITAVVGFALQDTLGNLFAGLSLHIENSLEVGDFVRVGDVLGHVEALSWRAVRVRTFYDSVLLISNSVAAREKLEVFPKATGPVASSFKILIEYKTPPTRVIRVLEKAAASVPGVSPSPRPLVLLSKFDDYAIEYEIRYWLDGFFELPKIDSAIKEKVWYVLRRERISIPIPHAVRINQQGEFQEAPRIASPEILKRVEILNPLTDAERSLLASRMNHCEYCPGEDIVVQGETDDSLYVVESGELSVLVVKPSGREVEVGTLSAGDAFGEMAILTGEPRSATVRAKSEAALFRVGKEALGTVLAANPRLPGEISQLAEERRDRTHGMLEAAGDSARFERGAHESILSRLARFFGLEEEA
jgi:small-conductance mechanosensitive channel